MSEIYLDFYKERSPSSYKQSRCTHLYHSKNYHCLLIGSSQKSSRSCMFQLCYYNSTFEHHIRDDLLNTRPSLRTSNFQECWYKSDSNDHNLNTFYMKQTKPFKAI